MIESVPICLKRVRREVLRSLALLLSLAGSPAMSGSDVEAEGTTAADPAVLDHSAAGPEGTGGAEPDG